MDFKNLSKKNILKIKSKIKSNKNELPQEIIRDILLFSESRKEIIEKKVLKNASKERAYHTILFSFRSEINNNLCYYFKTNNIYNPLTQTLVSTENITFNNRAELLNYISACGYRLRQPNSQYAFIYIPQDIMIKEYLMKKNEKNEK